MLVALKLVPQLLRHSRILLLYYNSKYCPFVSFGNNMKSVRKERLTGVLNLSTIGSIFGCRRGNGSTARTNKNSSIETNGGRKEECPSVATRRGGPSRLELLILPERALLYETEFLPIQS